jgi:type VI secretion system protein ImpH
MHTPKENLLGEDFLIQLQHDIQELNLDLRAEVIAASLIQKGMQPGLIIVQPKGNSQRAYRKDVSAFYTLLSDYDNTEYLYIETHRDGFYDALPENIFHQPTRGRTEKNKYEVIDEIKKHRAEEKAARKFFLPLEQEYTAVKTLLHILEDDFEKNTNNSRLINVFSEHWPILKKLDPYHAYIFLRIIPLIHTIRNNFELAGKTMSLILGIPVEIQLHQPGKIDARSFLFDLGGCVLGMDSTVGTDVFDGEYDLKVNIGPLKEQEIPYFITGGKYETIVDELLDYFIGANYLYHKEILIDELEKNFTLAADKVILGVNAFL